MSPGTQRPPLFAVAGALLLHAGLVAHGWRSGSGGAAAPRAYPQPAAVLSVRHLPAVAASPAGGAAPATDPAPERPPLSPAVVTGGVAPPTVSREQAVLEAQLAREAAATERALQDVARVWAEYRAADELTLRPQIRDLIQLPWPPGSEHLVGRVFKGRFKVFIDESGQVRRISAEGGTLLGPMVHVTEETFRGAHFAPGELDGQRVKAWIRIEVEYDARGILSTRTLN